MLKAPSISCSGLVPWFLLLPGATLLLLAQLATGTDLLYAELVFLFMVLTGGAINQCGGLKQLSGFCIAIMAFKTVVLGQVAKVILGESGHSNLDHPCLTMTVFVLGMAGLWLAALCFSPFRPRRTVLAPVLFPQSLQIAAWITSLIGLASVGVMMLAGFSGEGGLRVGGLPGLARQFTFCLDLGICFGTAHVITASQRRRCFGATNLLPFLAMLSYGIFTAGRLRMLQPFILLGLTAYAFGFHFRLRHFWSMLLVAAAAYFVVYPFGQVARNEIRGQDSWESVRLFQEFARRHFTSWDGFIEIYAKSSQFEDAFNEYSYFDRSVGMLERFALIKPADLLIAATLKQGQSGWETITHGLKMLLPRLVYPRKPPIGTGTFLGHKAGLLHEYDEGTQISFGFIADSFSSFGCWGAAICPFLLGGAFLLVYQRLVGGLDRNVWCVFLFADFQHSFTEQSIAGILLMVFQRPLWFLLIHGLIVASVRLWRYQQSLNPPLSVQETKFSALP